MIMHSRSDLYLVNTCFYSSYLGVHLVLVLCEEEGQLQQLSMWSKIVTSLEKLTAIKSKINNRVSNSTHTYKHSRVNNVTGT